MSGLEEIFLGAEKGAASSTLEKLLSVFDRGASDLHLAQDQPPYARIEGRLEALGDPLGKAEMEEVVSKLMGEDALASLYASRAEVDRTAEVRRPDGTRLRLRLNLALYQGRPFLVARRLREVEGDPRGLGVPEEFLRLLEAPHGLVLVVGATGSGKSTTLAHSLAYLLRNRPKRVITIEDPIEYLIPPGRGLITQREVGMDTESFATALKAAMREDPDVIMVGEMRDAETALAALAAAETGHLVLTTLHARSITEAADRLTGMFPPEAMPAVRYRFSRTFLGGLAQTLPRDRNGRRVLAWEFLRVENDEEREALLRPDGESVLRTLMAERGWRMADVLARLVRSGRLAPEEALRHLNCPSEREALSF
ncbi:type IV pilus twitching motility protein PilT [Thermosulfurimonas sp. F29]|uniref:type IV pilus twitching motility protein PilT n=1 Tax=Thermosulfurimonas sp. F29 TaxID=2867247 RepID=UPI001C834544|nr:ATPase, T2SS/T4P/T4SS family [Thermosulfurimonas sp. F29]MBX6424213.1 Flp pilus assembly complex ATPase component TadA [Thermosulfurimonas sp. F29]